MNNQPSFRYNPDTSSLEEISQLINGKHHNGLSIIPTDYKGWPTNIELIEGVHFEVKEKVEGKGTWGEKKTKIASPLLSFHLKEDPFIKKHLNNIKAKLAEHGMEVKEEQTNQEELWRDIFDTLLKSGNVYRYDYMWAIQQLHSKYTITRKEIPS